MVNTMSCLVIDCAQCPMRASSSCDDCVVTFVCDRQADEAVVFDFAEERAVRMLAVAGLVPGIRHPSAGRHAL